MNLVEYQKSVYVVCMPCRTCIYIFVLHKLILYLITILKTRESVILRVFVFPGPWPLAPAPSAGPQFVFTGPGPQFVFTGLGTKFVFTGHGPQFVFTGPGTKSIFTGPGLHLVSTPNLYLPAKPGT